VVEQQDGEFAVKAILTKCTVSGRELTSVPIYPVIPVLVRLSRAYWVLSDLVVRLPPARAELWQCGSVVARPLYSTATGRSLLTARHADITHTGVLANTSTINTLVNAVVKASAAKSGGVAEKFKQLRAAGRQVSPSGFS
jgi:hypothetical protein